MNDSPHQVISVSFANDSIYLQLADGRVIGNPLAWHPWLAGASAEQRANVELYELSVYFF